MIKKLGFYHFGLGLTLILLLASQAARSVNDGPAYVNICNEGNTTLHVARLTDGGRQPLLGILSAPGDWQLDGWYEIEPSGFSSSCKDLSRRGFRGSYYFAFMITGKNGRGFMLQKMQRTNSTYHNSDERFMVNMNQSMEYVDTIAAFRDIRKLPSGAVMAPFPIRISAWPGNDITLTMKPDSAQEVEVLNPLIAPGESTPAQSTESITKSNESNTSAVITTILVGAAAWALANLSSGGKESYKRPASLAGLPEETQKLFDEYHRCKIRTGQSDHLGSFGPCDEALFLFKESRAKATGQPPPTREVDQYWKSAKGPIGKVKERSYGTDVIFYEAPENFTPDIPDTQNLKMPLYFKLQFNEGKRGRIWKVQVYGLTGGGVYGKGIMRYRGHARDIVGQDYTQVRKAGTDTLLVCDYYNDGRTVNEVVYWFRKRPEAADPERLRSRMKKHPLLLVMNSREECPPVFTSETRQQRQALFDEFM